MSVSRLPDIPGHSPPAAGFDEPFELLGACHGRVRRSLALLQRLVAHLETHGNDAQARSAAADVWRYFEIAAPAHHEDEERHVIPRLLASGDPALMTTGRQLRADHERMDAVWATLSMRLRVLRDGHGGPLNAAALQALRDETARFVALHDTHVPLEEAVAFPAALARTDAQARRQMGDEMAARRGAVRPPP